MKSVGLPKAVVQRSKRAYSILVCIFAVDEAHYRDSRGSEVGRATAIENVTIPSGGTKPWPQNCEYATIKGTST